MKQDELNKLMFKLVKVKEGDKSILPTVTCEVCGDRNTHQELEVNYGRCVNCNTKLKGV